MNRAGTHLPKTLRHLFWDVDFSTLEWKTDRDLIVRRILQTGSWDAVRWLRSKMDDKALYTWLDAHDGARLSPRQLRYWELILDLPPHKVDHWLAQAKNNPWARRARP